MPLSTASKKRPLGQGNAIPRNLRDQLISGTGDVAPAGVVSEYLARQKGSAVGVYIYIYAYISTIMFV